MSKNENYAKAAGLVALGIGLGLFLRRRDQQEAGSPAPQAPQGGGQPQAALLAANGIMGYDPNGIPIIPLPAESARRTGMIQGKRPTIPGITPQPREGYRTDPNGGGGLAGEVRNEHFGGDGGDGERF